MLKERSATSLSLQDDRGSADALDSTANFNEIRNRFRKLKQENRVLE